MNASTPAGLLTALASGAGIVLAWVGVAVTAGVVLWFAFLGIRKGMQFFRHTADAGAGKHPGWIDTSGPNMGMTPPEW